MTVKLRQSTERIVRVGPFMDVADGATPETGITLGAADQAEALKAAGAATVDLSSNTWAAVTGASGWYNLTLSTSDTDTVGDLTVVVQDASVCLPVFVRCEVVEEAIFDALYAGSATGLLPANVTQISGDATAADNLEAVLDGTGGVTLTASAITLGTPIVANATQIEGADATDQIRDAVLDDATRFSGADIAAILTDTGTTLDGKIDAIQAVTDNLPDSGALSTIDGKLDTVQAATDLLVATGSETTATPAVTMTTLEKLDIMFQALLHRVDSGLNSKVFYKGNGTAHWSKALSDDGTTTTEAKGS